MDLTDDEIDDILDDMNDKISNKMLSSQFKQFERENKLESYKTTLKKIQFIGDIKNGLGEDIKSNPNSIKFIKKPWHQKLKVFFKNIFTKF